MSTAIRSFSQQPQAALQRRFDPDRFESRTTFGLIRLFGSDRRVDRQEARQLRQELDGDRYLRRHVNARVLDKFEEEGGDPTDDQSFFEWLKENLPAIIAFIKELIGLFGGGAMAPATAEVNMSAPAATPAKAKGRGRRRAA